MSVRENELVSRACAGDESALTDLLELHGPRVRDRLRIPPQWRPVLSDDDVMQQAYIEAFLHIRDFEPRGEGAFGSWLSKIATNVLQDAMDWLGALKRGGGRTRLERVSPERSSIMLIESLGVHGLTPSRDVAMREWVSRLRAALRRLPPRYEAVVVAFDLQQRPAESVAAELGCTLGAMYMLRRRAHWKLRELLGSTSSFAAALA